MGAAGWAVGEEGSGVGVAAQDIKHPSPANADSPLLGPLQDFVPL